MGSLQLLRDGETTGSTKFALLSSLLNGTWSTKFRARWVHHRMDDDISSRVDSSSWWREDQQGDSSGVLKLDWIQSSPKVHECRIGLCSLKHCSRNCCVESKLPVSLGLHRMDCVDSHKWRVWYKYAPCIRSFFLRSRIFCYPHSLSDASERFRMFEKSPPHDPQVDLQRKQSIHSETINLLSVCSLKHTKMIKTPRFVVWQHKHQNYILLW